MPTTLGAHFLDDLAGQEIADLARSYAGLSAASDWQAYSLFLDPYDTESDRRGYSFGYPNHKPDPIAPQSCCTKFLLAVARAAGKDGTIDWERQRRDVLRVPQASGLVGDSPGLARELGRQNGLLQEPGEERPDLRPGMALLIGGDDGLPPAQRIYGGMAHGLVVRAVREDGTIDTVEGGKGPGGTAIAEGHRELVRIGRHWWVRDVGATGGRMLRWWYQLADLPEVER